MKKYPQILVAALGLSMFTACATTNAADNDTWFAREGMVNGINPPITAIWDLQVEVMDDNGNFDPALMDEAKWAALLAQARLLDAAAQDMVTARNYAATDPLGTLGEAPEGTDLAAIDTRLQNHGAAFRLLASTLADSTGALVSAAEARDAATVTQLVNELQPQCHSCHEVFWYGTIE
jgi:cytochrome c556